MGHVQAVCHKCGHHFNSGIVMEGGSTGTLRGNTSQCPRCGDMAPIPDGSYRDGILQALRDSDLDRNDLLRLRESIQSALQSHKLQQTSNAVNEAMAVAPGLAERWKPQTPADRYAFLQALLAAIALLLILRPALQTTINNNTTIINKTVTVVQHDEPRNDEGSEAPVSR